MRIVLVSSKGRVTEEMKAFVKNPAPFSIIRYISIILYIYTVYIKTDNGSYGGLPAMRRLWAEIFSLSA